MNVLVLSEQFPPDRGGVAISAHRIVAGLSEAGVDVAVVSYDSGCAATELPHIHSAAVSRGLCVHRVGPYFKTNAEEVSEGEKAVLRRGAFQQVCELAERFRPDLIHSIYLSDAGFLASLVARRLGLPHLTSVRGTDLSRGLFHTGRFAQLRHTIESADGITFVNQYLERLARAAFQLPQVAQVVPNGVSVAAAPPDRSELRASLRSRYAMPHDEPVIGFVGWAREKKGLEDLLDALAAVERTAPRLLVVGDFPEKRDRAAFGDRVRTLGLDLRVALTGPLDHDRVRDLLPALDAVVIPSWEDGMPNVLLEAMERGVAVFGTDVFADVLEPARNGFLFERHDVIGLARLLDRYLQQPDVLAAVGAAARETVIQRFDQRLERAAYLRLYGALVSAPLAA